MHAVKGSRLSDVVPNYSPTGYLKRNKTFKVTAEKRKHVKSINALLKGMAVISLYPVLKKEFSTPYGSPPLHCSHEVSEEEMTNN